MRPRNGGPSGRGGPGRPRPPVSRSTRAPRASYTGSRYVPLRRPMAPYRASFDNANRRGARPLIATSPPPLACVATPGRVFYETGVVRHQSRPSRIIRIIRSPVTLLVGTLLTAWGGMAGMMRFVLHKFGFRSSSDLLDATEAENSDLHSRIQDLRKEVREKQEQLEGLREVNNEYTLQKIPDLRNQIKTRDELLANITDLGNERGAEVLVNLHNRLASKDATINYLRSIKTKSYQAVEDMERRLRHKDTQLVQAREEISRNLQTVENLMKQLKEKDAVIMSITGEENASDQTEEALRKHIWEQSKIIEELKTGASTQQGGGSIVLQKQVADQDHIIATLRRRLEYTATTSQVLDTFFFPDDNVRTTLHRLTQFLKTVKTSLNLCVPNIVSTDLADGLIAAHKRGVVVKIVCSDEQGSSKASDIQRIAAQGIPVQFDNSRTHLHHSFFIADGVLVGNGSFSWTQQAARYNRENLIIYSDLRLAESFLAEFQQLWSAPA